MSACPEGFVLVRGSESSAIGGDSSSSSSSYPSCHASCRSHVYTDEEWQGFLISRLVASWLGLACMLALFCVWFCAPLRKQQFNKPFMSLYAAISFALSFCLAVLSTVEQVTGQSAFPASSSLCQDDDNTPGDSSYRYTSTTSCKAESFLIVYFFLALSLCWCIQSVETFLRLNFGLARNVLPMFANFYMPAILTLPLIPALYLVSTGREGYTPGESFCLISGNSRNNNNDLSGIGDVAIFYIQLTVTTGIALIVTTTDISKTLIFACSARRLRRNRVCDPVEAAEEHSAEAAVASSPTRVNRKTRVALPIPLLLPPHDGSTKAGKAPVSSPSHAPPPPPPRIVRSNSSPTTQSTLIIGAVRTILLAISCIAPSLTVVCLRYAEYATHDRRTRALNSWQTCVLNNYYNGTTGVSGGDWQSVCGEHVSVRTSYAAKLLLTLCVFGQSIPAFIAFIVLSQPTSVRIRYAVDRVNLILGLAPDRVKRILGLAPHSASSAGGGGLRGQGISWLINSQVRLRRYSQSYGIHSSQAAVAVNRRYSFQIPSFILHHHSSNNYGGNDDVNAVAAAVAAAVTGMMVVPFNKEDNNNSSNSNLNPLDMYANIRRAAGGRRRRKNNNNNLQQQHIKNNKIVPTLESPRRSSDIAADGGGGPDITTATTAVTGDINREIVQKDTQPQQQHNNWNEDHHHHHHHHVIIVAPKNNGTVTAIANTAAIDADDEPQQHQPKLITATTEKKNIGNSHSSIDALAETLVTTDKKNMVQFFGFGGSSSTGSRKRANHEDHNTAAALARQDSFNAYAARMHDWPLQQQRQEKTNNNDNTNNNKSGMKIAGSAGGGDDEEEKVLNEQVQEEAFGNRNKQLHG